MFGYFFLFFILIPFIFLFGTELKRAMNKNCDETLDILNCLTWIDEKKKQNKTLPLGVRVNISINKKIADAHYLLSIQSIEWVNGEMVIVGSNIHNSDTEINGNFLW